MRQGSPRGKDGVNTDVNDRIYPAGRNAASKKQSFLRSSPFAVQQFIRLLRKGMRQGSTRGKEGVYTDVNDRIYPAGRNAASKKQSFYGHPRLSFQQFIRLLRKGMRQGSTRGKEGVYTDVNDRIYPAGRNAASKKQSFLRSSPFAVQQFIRLLRKGMRQGSTRGKEGVYTNVNDRIYPAGRNAASKKQSFLRSSPLSAARFIRLLF
jgi:hypothetical protein